VDPCASAVANYRRPEPAVDRQHHYRTCGSRCWPTNWAVKPAWTYMWQRQPSAARAASHRGRRGRAWGIESASVVRTVLGEGYLQHPERVPALYQNEASVDTVRARAHLLEHF